MKRSQSQIDADRRYKEKLKANGFKELRGVWAHESLEDEVKDKARRHIKRLEKKRLAEL